MGWILFEYALGVMNAYLVIQAYSRNEVDWITVINIIFVIVFTMSMTARVTNRTT